MSPHEQIVSSIDAFLARVGKSDRWLSLQVAKDPKTIQRIREGQSTLQTLTNLHEFMDGYASPEPEEAA